MTDTEIKVKIRKLLELSKSPNENEAAAALQKANTLMETYRLSESQCMETEYVCEMVRIIKSYSWREKIVTATAWLYSVYPLKYSGSRQQAFYGEKLDAFMAAEMYSYLVKTLERLARQNIRKNAKKAYRDSWKLGIADRLSARIFEIGVNCSWAPEREQRRSAVARYVKSQRSVETMQIPKRKQNKTAWQKGMIAGETVSLNRQATGNCGRMLGYGSVL
jgi:hypothetical protein